MKKLFIILLCIVMTFSIIGCGSSSGSTAPAAESAESAESAAPAAESTGSTDAVQTIKSSRDTVIIGNQGDIMSLNPLTSNSQTTQNVLSQIYETLIGRDPETGEYYGILAESWEFEDDSTIIFHLRQGVKFHNGEEMKASDVLFSIQRWNEAPPLLSICTNIDFDRTKVVDDYTFQLATKGPFAPQVPMMEYPACAIISEKAYTESDGDFTKAPIGTGPYELQSWVTGDSVTLTAFKDYWDAGLPYVKTLVFRSINDDTMRTIELETGGIDYSIMIDPNDWERVESNPELKMYRAMSMNTRYLLFNCADEIFKDVRIRQAVNYALNIEDVVHTAWGKDIDAAKGYFTPTIPGFKEGLVRQQDLDKAKELLAEAGYENGLSCKLISNTTKTDAAMAVVIQAQLAKVGIDVEVVTEPTATLTEDMWAKNFDLLIYGYTAVTGEPDRALRRWHKDAGEFEMYGWYNEEYSDLLDSAGKEIDPEKRNEMYGEAQQIIFDETVAIPLLHKEIVCATKADIKGFYIEPTYEHNRLKYIYTE